MTNTIQLSATDPTYDVIVVGARCAGSTAATVLARAGRRVLLVDRDRFPSDTLSTHQLFPDSLELLDRLGVGRTLRARHQLHPTRYSWRVLGHAVTGGFTAIGGHDRTMSVRRITLDAILVETAEHAGAELRTGTAVEALIGEGTAEDPVRGVVLADGERVFAPWVVAADGRTSTVARRLKLPKTGERQGEMAMMVAYWKGLPASDTCRIDVHERHGIMSAPCEDGYHQLSVAGAPDLTSGAAEERQAAYLSILRRFPAVLNPRLLEHAEQVTPVVAIPETMLRGFQRQANGAGWVLVGDAGSFKHPFTAQGIGDALAQGWHVGEALARGDDLTGYASWRADRDAGHYDWSFDAARFPTSKAAAIYSGLAADDVAGAQFLDSFSKQADVREVLSAERMRRWMAAWTYDAGLRELCSLLDNLAGQRLGVTVAACPGWTVGDLVAHVIGVAEDSTHGRFFAGAPDAWDDEDLAHSRERWTANHLERHAERGPEALMRRLDQHGSALVQAVRRGRNPVASGADWGPAAPVADLAAHVADLREALGLEADSRSPLARFGFAVYRDWLHQRLLRRHLPALRLDDGRQQWDVGEGKPMVTVTAEPHELFRMVSGRRSARQITGLAWTGDPTPYLPVIAPYPLPA